MSGHIHLVKLCVGADGIEDLRAWQASAAARGSDGRPRHVTRMWPKRAAELLAGGSLYWVFRGEILVRQRIERLDRIEGSDGVLRCGLVLDPALVRTEPARRKPFQGWRYLRTDEAPADLAGARATETALPPELAMALAQMGVR